MNHLATRCIRLTQEFFKSAMRIECYVCGKRRIRKSLLARSKAATRSSNDQTHSLDYFAEPVIGRAFVRPLAPTRWFVMTISNHLFCYGGTQGYFNAEPFDSSATASWTVVMNCAGKMMVEFFSIEISAIVCRVRS